MSTLTFMDKQRNQLIKKLHVLRGHAKMSDQGYRAFLWSNYQAESSTELNAYELMEACSLLDKIANPKTAEIDKARKRVIAVIFAYYKALGTPADMEYVKGTACRAAGVDTSATLSDHTSATLSDQEDINKKFNRISLEKLRGIYAAFGKKAKVGERVNEIVSEDVGRLKTLN